MSRTPCSSSGGGRVGWRLAPAGLLLACAQFTLFAATKAEPKAAAIGWGTAEAEAARALFARLGAAFRAGDYKMARELFAPPPPGGEERRAQVIQALRAEFRTEKYTSFELLECAPDDRLDAKRWGLWVRLRTISVLRAQNLSHENCHNDTFVVQRLPDDSFALLDSPYFDTLGRRQGVGLLADAILAAILILAGLVFWVWMGCEAFSLRPRRVAWRIVVVLLPVLGALVFFIVQYVPAWRRGRTPTAELWRPPTTNSRL